MDLFDVVLVGHADERGELYELHALAGDNGESGREWGQLSSSFENGKEEVDVEPTCHIKFKGSEQKGQGEGKERTCEVHRVHEEDDVDRPVSPKCARPGSFPSFPNLKVEPSQTDPGRLPSVLQEDRDTL